MLAKTAARKSASRAYDDVRSGVLLCCKCNETAFAVASTPISFQLSKPRTLLDNPNNKDTYSLNKNLLHTLNAKGGSKFKKSSGKKHWHTIKITEVFFTSLCCIHFEFSNMVL